MEKIIVIRATTPEILNLEIDKRKSNGYKLVKGLPQEDYNGMKLYCAALSRDNDMMYKIFGV